MEWISFFFHRWRSALPSSFWLLRIEATSLTESPACTFKIISFLQATVLRQMCLHGKCSYPQWLQYQNTSPFGFSESFFSVPLAYLSQLLSLPYHFAGSNWFLLNSVLLRCILLQLNRCSFYTTRNFCLSCFYFYRASYFFYHSKTSL